MYIVTSTYNDFKYDKLKSFAKKYNHKLIVYQKIDNYNKKEYKTKFEDGVELKELKNYGRCDYAFIKFIVDNYDNLPDKIFFTKANFFSQQININYANRDYKFNLIGKDLKYVIMDKTFDKNKLININNNSIEDVSDNYKATCDQLKDTYRNPMIMDFYKLVFKDYPCPNNYYKAFGHGPCFTVTKELILRHSKDIYLKLLDLFENDENWDKKQGVIEDLGRRYHDHFQRFWHILFTHGLNLDMVTDDKNFIAFK